MLGVRSERDKASTSSVVTEFRRSPRSFEVINTEERKVPPLVKIEKNKLRPFTGSKNTARFASAEQIAGGSFFDIIYLPLGRYKKTADNVTGVVLPAVITDLETVETCNMLKNAYAAGARYALAGNIGHIPLAQRYGFIVRGDFRLNIYNSFTLAVYSSLDGVILSPELTLPQIRDIGTRSEGSAGLRKGVIVYGRLPLMLLEKPVGNTVLRDRKNTCFPVIESGGRDILLNSVPVYMADKSDALDLAGINERHFMFTVETRREAAAVVEAYKKGAPPSGNVKRIK
jgi:putative protease